MYDFVLYKEMWLQLFLSELKTTRIKNCWHNRSKIVIRKIITNFFCQIFHKNFANFGILLHSFFLPCGFLLFPVENL